MLDPSTPARRASSACCRSATRRPRRASRSSSAASPGCATRASSRSPRSAATPWCRLPARAVVRPAGRGRRCEVLDEGVALGLVPDLTGTKPLVEHVGYARALRSAPPRGSCRPTRRCGSVWRPPSVPAADLDAAVADLAAALVAPMPGSSGDQGAAAGRGRPRPRRAAPPRAGGTGTPLPRGRGGLRLNLSWIRSAGAWQDAGSGDCRGYEATSPGSPTWRRTSSRPPRRPRPGRLLRRGLARPPSRRREGAAAADPVPGLGPEHLLLGVGRPRRLGRRATARDLPRRPDDPRLVA